MTQKCFPLFLLLVSAFFSGKTFSQYSGQHFIITVGNSTIFDLYAEGHPDEGEGIFHPYTSVIKKNSSFTYECKNDNAFKGVEGHIKFRAFNNEVPGWVDIYFDNPAIGSMTYNASADWPFIVENVVAPMEKRNPNVWISIRVDTVKDIRPPVPFGKGSGTVNTGPPQIINFEWEVDQRMLDDETGGYENVKYLFTTNGDYAGIKRDGDDLRLLVYTASGQTLMFDDKKKTVTIMNMIKTVGEGSLIAKQTAESISKQPLIKDHQDDEISVVKSGRTKLIQGYMADEYVTKIAGEKGLMTFWYAKVPFEPMKAFTMGVDRPADLSKFSSNPKLRNNPFALSILNKNYLWIETDAGGRTVMETTGIFHRKTVISTEGYQVKVFNSLKQMIGEDEK